MSGESLSRTSYLRPGIQAGLSRNDNLGSTADVTHNDWQTHCYHFQRGKGRRFVETTEDANVKRARVRSHDLREFGENDEGVMATSSIQKGCQASCSGVRHRCA